MKPDLLRLQQFWFLTALCFVQTSIVVALLYPTKPIGETVYVAGQPASIAWIEDGQRPLLNESFGMRIDLYAGKNTFLATLAKGGSALDLSRTVFIPSRIPPNYHYFNLRFIFAEPSMIIYTADFNIIPNPNSGPALPSSRSSWSRMSASMSASPTSGIKAPVTTITSTITSRISGTQDMQPPLSSVISEASPVANWLLPSSRRVFKKFEIEKMKFRLLFIVWPALVGLSMAL